MSEDTDNSLDSMISTLAEKGLSDLLDEPDIKQACLNELRDLGCKPPANHVVLFCLKKAVSAALPFGKEAFKSRLESLASKNGIVNKFLSKIYSIHSGVRDKIQLKEELLSGLSSSWTEEEIKENQSKSLEVLSCIYSMKKLEGLDESIADLYSNISHDLRTALADCFEPNLLWPYQKAAQSAADSIRYDSQKYKFLGRDRELEELRGFLGDPTMYSSQRFRWLLITGEGGAGKTRLAFEFVRNLPAGWNGGLLSGAEMKRLVAQGKWIPRASTLFVVDYAAQYPREVGELLRFLTVNAEAFDFPVRVLILERSNSGDWYSTMLPASTSAVVRENIYRRERFEGGLALAPLMPDAIIEMMEQRLIDEGLSAPKPAELLAAVVKVDPRKIRTSRGDVPVPRPLFAAAVVELAIVKMKEKGVSFKSAAHSFSQGLVMRGLIERDRQLRWGPACVEGGSPALQVHEYLLAAATFCMGISRGDYLSILPNKVAPFLPSPLPAGTPPLELKILEAMGSDNAASEINSLEPDILGEVLVVEKLKELKTFGVLSDFLEYLFELGRNNAAIFSLRLLNDFPNEVASLGYLRPSLDCREEAAKSYLDFLFHAAAWSGVSRDVEKASLFYAKAKDFRSRSNHKLALAPGEIRCFLGVAAGKTATGKPFSFEEVEGALIDLVSEYPEDDAVNAQYAEALGACLEDNRNQLSIEEEESIWGRIQNLNQKFSKSEVVLSATSKSIVRISSSRGDRMDWVGIERCVNMASEALDACPGSSAIAASFGFVLHNAIYDLVGAGQLVKAQEYFLRFDDLLEAFEGFRTIAVERFKAILKIRSASFQDKNWEDLEGCILLAREQCIKYQYAEEFVAEYLGLLSTVLQLAWEDRHWPVIDVCAKRGKELLQDIAGQDNNFERIAGIFINASVMAGELGLWRKSDELYSEYLHVESEMESEGRQFPKKLKFKVMRYSCLYWGGKEIKRGDAYNIIDTLFMTDPNRHEGDVNWAFSCIKEASRRFPSDQKIMNMVRQLREAEIDVMRAMDLGDDWGFLPPDEGIEDTLYTDISKTKYIKRQRH